MAADVRGLVIDPFHGNILYAAAATHGVLRSNDGGITWIEINRGLPYRQVFSLAIDPSNSTTLYAGTEAGIFKTKMAGNGGWLSAGGLQPPRPVRLFFQPR